MKTIEAVQHVLETQGITKYRLAMSLGLAPVSINQYLRGTCMSQATADKFKQVYGITVTDVR
ncbi:DNA binding protein [Vibrio phage VPMS1]|uniref:DNA binding protein n=1 Tax=Vibrio phage VPMS1 TaxID=1233488 RepID=UPI0003585A9F|nr:DNA binding protein [Vibrio phage VPMS1]AFV51110.1 DNA binding protein [Vibrio phage VPMS1]